MATPMNNTGNAVGSTDPRDLIDNAQVLDGLVNGDAAEVTARTGKVLKSWEGMQSDSDARIAEIDSIITSLDSAGVITVPTVAAGLAATTNGQYFREPQGPLSDQAFNYYRNNAGVALLVATLSSSAKVTKALAAALKNTAKTDNTIGGRSSNIVTVEPGIYVLTTGATRDSTLKEVRGVDFLFLKAGDVLACPYGYNLAGVFYDSPQPSSYNGKYFTYRQRYIAAEDSFVRLVFKYVGTDSTIDPSLSTTFSSFFIIRKRVYPLANLADNGIKSSKVNLLDYETDYEIQPGALSGTTGDEIDQPRTFVNITGFIPVKTGDSFSITNGDYYFIPLFYDKDKKFLSSPGVWTSSPITSGQDGYVRFSTKRKDETDAINSQSYAFWIRGPSQLYNLIKSISLRAAMPSQWSFKKWFSIGDSITARDWYQPLVTSILGIGSYDNYGVSGTCIAATGPSDTQAMSVRYKNITGTPDVITVWGGVNDFGYGYGSRTGIILGSSSDTENTTFYGALRVLIEGLVSKFPDAKLAFIITTPVSLARGMNSANGKGFYLSQYCEAIRFICQEYSIPYLDLQRLSGFNQYNIEAMTSNEEGTATDGLHPSRKGMAWVSTKIAAFLNGL